MPLLNLRHFLTKLRAAGEVCDVQAEVDPTLEIAEIHRRVAAAEGPALFFHRVKGSSFPVVTNLFGTKKRVDLAFGAEPLALISSLVEMMTHTFPPPLSMLWKKRETLKSLFSIGSKKRSLAPVQEQKMAIPDLTQIPLLQTWPLDGGHFITLPLVYTEPVGGGPPNLGMYRIQRYGCDTAGLHFQIQKGGGFHYFEAERKNMSLPVSIFVGGAPALILSAITPLPENVPELLICGLLQGEKLGISRVPDSPYPLIAECEFALLGMAKPHLRHPEGPFGDHYGYYSLTHDFPLFQCNAIYHRKDAIYPATVVGKPRQEDFFLGEYLQHLLSPLFPVVMPGVKALWSYGETGFHPLSAVIIRERYYRECMTSAFRILGEGQLSLTKFLLVTDQPIDLHNFTGVLTTILERFQPETDLFIFSNLSLDTLDYTGPQLNKGSRGIMLGIGEKIRSLPHQFQGSLPSGVKEVAAFSPGCLLLSCHAFSPTLATEPAFAAWPLLIVVDDIHKAGKHVTAFLWTVFTRFEPAADIYAASQTIVRHHVSYRGPILIDAQMKPSYPPEVLCDEKTASLVSQRWSTYFPQGMEMGNSLTADVV